MNTITKGTVSWVDLSTPDMSSAQGFYGDLFAWELDSEHTEMGDYVVASSGGREVVGMMAQSAAQAGMPAFWTVYVVVDDLEDTLRRFKDAGGSAAPPFEIPGGARVAAVSDASGAMFAVISGGPDPDAPYLSTEVGSVCWTELMSADVDAAKEFYRDVFGWTAETDETGPVPYTVFRLGDEDVAGMIARPADLPSEVPDSWSVYFTVAGCEDTQQLATELGGSVLLPARPTPMGPFAVLADPSGGVFQIMELTNGM